MHDLCPHLCHHLSNADVLKTVYQTHPEHLSPYTEAVFGDAWGLGLTLSQEIVERHGGHMEVDVSGNNGVTCSVRLPLHTA